MPAGQQDVEAQLWQDPFAAVENYEARSKSGLPAQVAFQQVIRTTQNTGGQTEVKVAHQTREGNLQTRPHTPDDLRKRIGEIHKDGGRVKLIGVSVFGASSEAAENRRRTRFAVISELRAHSYALPIPARLATSTFSSQTFKRIAIGPLKIARV